SLDSPNTVVKDLMTSEPIAVKKDETIRDVLELMSTNKIQRLPVIDKNNNLIGLVVQSQILKKLFEYMKK
ncbi:MAG: CBS domain-containing protein, partial [Candidatus Heimdallarchaeota archaeon]